MLSRSASGKGAISGTLSCVNAYKRKLRILALCRHKSNANSKLLYYCFKLYIPKLCCLRRRTAMTKGGWIRGVMLASEVVVAMNPLHSQRKERKVLRGSSGTMPAREMLLSVFAFWFLSNIPTLNKESTNTCLAGAEGGWGRCLPVCRDWRRAAAAAKTRM